MPARGVVAALELTAAMAPSRRSRRRRATARQTWKTPVALTSTQRAHWASLRVGDVGHFQDAGDAGQAVERAQGGLGLGDDLFDLRGVAHVQGGGPQAVG